MTVLTGVQCDWDTQKWYFMIYADESRKKVRFQSKPTYETDEDAQEAAIQWVRSDASQ